MEGESLLRAIRQAPEDDDLRLVYADWLEEQGRLERAEFIRVQIERARTSLDDPRYPDLRRREAELFEGHGAAWLREELPEGMVLEGRLDHYKFERGLQA